MGRKSLLSRELLPYTAGALVGAVATVAATRYMLYDVSDSVPELTKWSCALLTNLVPVGPMPLLFYGAIFGVSAVNFTRRDGQIRKKLEARISTD